MLAWKLIGMDPARASARHHSRWGLFGCRSCPRLISPGAARPCARKTWLWELAREGSRPAKLSITFRCARGLCETGHSAHCFQTACVRPATLPAAGMPAGENSHGLGKKWERRSSPRLTRDLQKQKECGNRKNERHFYPGK